eukprot:COSAG01_NODE_3086_length_6611_cov_12.899109_8_plen_78_part_00
MGVPAGAWQRRLLIRGRHCFCRCCTSMRTGEHPAGRGEVQNMVQKCIECSSRSQQQGAGASHVGKSQHERVPTSYPF